MLLSIWTVPKSMATVVVVLAGVWPTSSTPAAADVISDSVVSGVMSEMDATVVVLPTPNPPAMTIFTGVGASRYVSDATYHSHDQLGVGCVGRAHDMDVETAVGVQVGDEDLRHAEVQPQFGRDLGDRDGGRGDGNDVGERRPERRGA